MNFGDSTVLSSSVETKMKGGGVGLLKFYSSVVYIRGRLHLSERVKP